MAFLLPVAGSQDTLLLHLKFDEFLVFWPYHDNQLPATGMPAVFHPWTLNTSSPKNFRSIGCESKLLIDIY